MTSSATPPVSISREAGVAVVLLDNPPVNALSHHLREALRDALRNLAAEAHVGAIVIACAGKTFVSGADIGELGTQKSTAAPVLPELCAQIESMGKPVVAAIHGSALGGGLELAMACHFRVANADARLGLPEVKLGILPGSGGTVRLPRLVGPVEALDMIVSGEPVGASRALETGLVDEITAGDAIREAVAFAERHARTAAEPLPVRARDERLKAEGAAEAFERAAAQAASLARGLEAPLACIDAVRNAVNLPFDEALKREREAFLRLVASPQAKAQRHLFFAERAATRVPGVGREVSPLDVQRVGVVGAGLMGTGIATAFAGGGFDVTLVETSAEALARGMARIERNFSSAVSRGSLDQAEMDKRLSRIGGVLELETLSACDLIVEAVFEDMAVKKEVFARLGAIARPDALLATNTSYLDVDEIASAAPGPERVVGLHFFSPAHVMKLLEIVRGGRTSARTLVTAIDVARRIGKLPVVVGVCHGFVGNRMLTALRAQNEALLLEGASPQTVDQALTAYGFAMGPFQMTDMAGLDISWRNRKARGQTAPIADALCEMGRFGQKTGAGYYRYEDGSRTPLPDPAVDELITETANARGLSRRTISEAEILERTLYAMINEGAHILQEGIALRASDIDLVWVHGYGFPRAKGGPMHWAQAHGLAEIVARLDHWHGATKDDVFSPAPLMRELALSGRGFADMGTATG